MNLSWIRYNFFRIICCIHFDHMTIVKREGRVSMVDQWNPELYDGEHGFVSSYGQHVLSLLDPKKGERILDLGCGTGDLANELSLLDACVVGVDQSESMITQARKKYPAISFDVKDILALGYTNEFDAVFSNAVLHWVKSPQQSLTEIYKSLKRGGRFVAEFGGEGNIQQITDQIMKQKRQMGDHADVESFPWYFPSIGEYTSRMERAGFQVIYAEHIDRPTKLEGKEGLRNWLEMFSSSFFGHIHIEDKHVIFNHIESALESELFHTDHWVADYKRIRVKGIKI